MCTHSVLRRTLSLPVFPLWPTLNPVLVGGGSSCINLCNATGSMPWDLPRHSERKMRSRQFPLCDARSNSCGDNAGELLNVCRVGRGSTKVCTTVSSCTSRCQACLLPSWLTPTLPCHTFVDRHELIQKRETNTREERGIQRSGWPNQEPGGEEGLCRPHPTRSAAKCRCGVAAGSHRAHSSRCEDSLTLNWRVGATVDWGT